jgi:hypothetical protein
MRHDCVRTENEHMRHDCVRTENEHMRHDCVRTENEHMRHDCVRTENEHMRHDSEMNDRVRGPGVRRCRLGEFGPPLVVLVAKRVATASLKFRKGWPPI